MRNTKSNEMENKVQNDQLTNGIIQEHNCDMYLLHKSYSYISKDFAMKNKILYKKIDLYNQKYNDIEEKLIFLKQQGTLTRIQEINLKEKQEEIESKIYDIQYESFFNSISMYKYKILEESSLNSPNINRIKNFLNEYDKYRGYVGAPYNIQEEFHKLLLENNKNISLLKQNIKNCQNDDKEMYQIKRTLYIEMSLKSINEIMLEYLKKEPNKQEIKNKIFNIATFKKEYEYIINM